MLRFTGEPNKLINKPPTYADDLTVKDALAIYFSKYHFRDGGYNDKWFRIKLGKIFIPLPNIKARVQAVKIHDIHHLVTEYNADWKGETQIGAWEIASGCGKHYVAWLLNFGSFFVGMFLYPRSLFKAFMRGRHCATNLYSDTVYNERLLNTTIGDIRKITAIDSMDKCSAADYLAFFSWCGIVLIYYGTLAAAAGYFLRWATALVV